MLVCFKERQYAGDRGLRGQEHVGHFARPRGARRGDRHHPARQGGGPPCAKLRWNRPRAGSRRLIADSRPGEETETRSVRLAGPESRPGRRPAMSLVLDSSATLAWVYATET